MERITKAVFPVAGLGTRFLPATKAMPKELLPIIDKPVIQFAVQEAISAGITDMVFVTGRTKRAIEDHFDGNPELESVLAERGKHQLLDEIRNIIPPGVNCIFVRQTEALGLGHAILCAEPALGGEPFAVLLPDDLMAGDSLPTTDLVQHYQKTGKSCISVARVPEDKLDQYGVILPVSNIGSGAIEISGIVEKPKPSTAPSNLAAIGRYVFHPEIFDKLRVQAAGVGGEIQLTDSINLLAKAGRVGALEFAGRRYDCGSKFGFLEAIVDHALEHPEFGEDFEALIQKKANATRRTRSVA